MFDLSRNGLADQVRLCSSAATLRKPAFLVIDALQSDEQSNSGEKIVATAVALLAMVEATGVPLDDVIFKALAITRDVEGPFTGHLQAVREYARDHLRGAR